MALSYTFATVFTGSHYLVFLSFSRHPRPQLYSHASDVPSPSVFQRRRLKAKEAEADCYRDISSSKHLVRLGVQRKKSALRVDAARRSLHQDCRGAAMRHSIGTRKE